jgi:8-oxo-dGTP diphosphatase
VPGPPTRVRRALREAGEETGLDTAAVQVVGELLDDHGGWAYTTVVARAELQLPVHALDRESTDVRWVAAEGVPRLPLHPGFALTWPELRTLL